MKRFRAILILSLAAALIGGGLACLAAGSDSPEKLRASVETAFKAKDAEAIYALVKWDGVTERMNARMKSQLKAIAKHGVSRITLAALPADRPLTNELNGILYSPNVRVTGNLAVYHGDYDDPDDTAIDLPYGESGGKYYISAVTEQLVHPTP